MTTKRHMICEGHGIPVALVLAPGNRHDVTHAIPALEALSIPRRGGGPPRTRPIGLAADKGYDYPFFRRYLRERGIHHSIPQRRGKKPRPGRPYGYDLELSKHRWIIEQTHSRLEKYRRLATRWERISALHESLLHLASIMICLTYF